MPKYVDVPKCITLLYENVRLISAIVVFLIIRCEASRSMPITFDVILLCIFFAPPAHFYTLYVDETDLKKHMPYV